VKMYRPGKSGTEREIVEEEGVREKFGVLPAQVIDVLALTGDKSDNVPGVPGIGEKTAIPLIQIHGNLDSLFRHLERIPQKGVREKLSTHRDLAFLSRELVTIDTAVPLQIDFHDLRAAPPDTARLISLFADLEFRSLAAKLRERERGSAPLARPAEEKPREVAHISSQDHNYHLILTSAELLKLVALLDSASQFVFDTETTSRNPLRAELVGLSFSLREHEAFYVPVRRRSLEVHGDASARFDHTDEALPLEEVLGALRPVFESERINKLGQNIKYDLLVLASHGCLVRGVLRDTMVASYVLRSDGQHNLDALAMEHLHYRMVSFQELVGKGKAQLPITEVPLRKVAEYSAEDADITLRVFSKQIGKLQALELLRLCEEVEFPLIRVLTRMELAGVALDREYLSGMSKDLERQLEHLVSEIHRLAGETFNINSTQQLGEILFGKLKLPVVRKTKTGFSTDVGVLETLRNQHPVVEKVLEYRQLTKLKSTYVDALPGLILPRTGRVHTSFNQTVASTGRLSSSDPNLQNIPIRTDIGSAIRKAFITGDPESWLLSADYSQIELRIMAHVSRDESLLEAFQKNEDIHTTTAARVFGVKASEITREMRRKAKEVNFGIMYGIGPFGLAKRLEISQGESREIIARYFERFPRVREYIAETLESARKNGYVATLLGRRRYLPDISSRNQAVRGNAERQAINMPIQGSAADMIKLAMIAIDREIERRGMSSKMLLQVHDELIFEVPGEEKSQMEELVVERMQNAMKLRVPIQVEVGFGKNWLEAH
jgi:DNA polymerase-1